MLDLRPKLLQIKPVGLYRCDMRRRRLQRQRRQRVEPMDRAAHAFTVVATRTTVRVSTTAIEGERIVDEEEVRG
jgi:hypothetical protein